MTEIDPQNPPKTSREIGIHLVYMSKANEDLKASIESLKETIERLTSTYATKKELVDAVHTRQLEQEQILKDLCAVDNRVKKLERLFEGITAKIAGLAITLLVLMILAQYGLEKYFRG